MPQYIYESTNVPAMDRPCRQHKELKASEDSNKIIMVHMYLHNDSLAFHDMHLKYNILKS